MKEHKIYTLTCPLDGQIKYIGRTSQELKSRASAHYYSNEGGLNKLLWIEKLKVKRLMPIIEALETVVTDKMQLVYDIEMYWINQFKQWGFNLLNGMHYSENKRRNLTVDEYNQLKKKEYAYFCKQVDNLYKPKRIKKTK